jgi:hypothetical protein
MSEGGKRRTLSQNVICMCHAQQEGPFNKGQEGLNEMAAGPYRLLLQQP